MLVNSFRTSFQPAVIIALCIVAAATSALAQTPNQSIAITAPVHMAVGDFNGDGRPDIAVVTGTNRVAIYMNLPSGFVQAGGSPYTVGTTPDLQGPPDPAIVTGDFNGDGKLDLAVANILDSTVTILIGNGAGGFQVGAPISVGNLGSTRFVSVFPTALAVGDFDGDGKRDLAVVDYIENTVRILLGNGSGGFSQTFAPISVGKNPTAIVAGDFNGDGVIDLAVSNNGDNNVTVLLGTGRGSFIAPAGSPLAVGSGPNSLALGDLNSDGKLDLAIANFNSGNVSIYLGNGKGGFTQATGSPFPVGGSQPNSVAIGDIDGDGVPDLLFADVQDGAISILIGNGSGGFTLPSTGKVQVGKSPISALLADLSGSGRNDILVANRDSNSVSFLVNTAVPALSISKTHAGTFTQGQQGAYTLVVSNTGTGSTPGPIFTGGGIGVNPVIVVDNPPAGMTVTAMSGTGWSCMTGTSNRCNRFDSLAAGQSFPAITVMVSVAANASASLTNVATATGGGTTGTATAPDQTTIQSFSSLSISATAGSGQSAAVNAAFAIVLQAAVTDASGAPIPGRVVIFTAPATGPSGTWAGTTSIIVAATTDSAGRAMAAAFTANGTAGTYNVTATSGGASTLFALTNTPVGSPALSIAKAHTGVFTQGQQGTYTVIVSNTGTVPTLPSASVQVQETPPAGMTVTSLAGAGWQCATTSNACSRNDSLPAGQSFPAITVTVTVAANASTPLNNLVSAAGGGTTAPVTAMDQTIIVGQPAGTILATAGGGQTAAVNGSFSTALQVTLTSSTGASVNGASVTFTAPATGASGTWSGSATVTATTDTSGRATAPTFRANGVAGNYSVTAMAGTASTTFALTNLAAVSTTGPALLAPKTVGFDFTPGGPATVTQNVTVSNVSVGSIPFTYRVVYPLAPASEWLSVAPASLITPAVLGLTANSLTANSMKFPPGQYLALIIVTPTAAATRSSATTDLLAPNLLAPNPADEASAGSGVIIAAVMNIPGVSPLTLMAPRCLWMSADIAPNPAGSSDETNMHCSYAKTDDSAPATYVLSSTQAATDFAASLTFGTVETDWLTAQLGADTLANGRLVTGKTVASVNLNLQKSLLRYDNQLAYIVTGNDKGAQLGLINAAANPALTAMPATVESDAGTGFLKATSPEAVSSKSVTVSATGGTLPFTARADVPWISVTPSSGTASPGKPVIMTVSVDPTGLKAARSGGTILLQRTDASTPPTSVSVVSRNTVPVSGLPVITSVVNGASFQPPGIAPGAWVTIKGTGLSNGAPGRTWRTDELGGGRLPTSLDGVSVMVDGKPAYVEYVSAIQLNVLPAADSSQGEATVIVNNNGRISEAVSAFLQPLSPAFFQIGKYAIAQRCVAVCDVVVGNPIYLPAKPGDAITLWTTGLGPTSPAVPDGMLPTVPPIIRPTAGATVIATPTVQLGGIVIRDSDFLGAAISGFSGTYQVNIRIPDSVPNGDVPITVSTGGITSPDGVFLYVQR